MLTVKNLRRTHPAQSRLEVIGLVAASFFCLLGGAFVAGSLVGGPGLAVGGAGFAAYLLLFARAFRARGAARRNGIRIDALF